MEKNSKDTVVEKNMINWELNEYGVLIVDGKGVIEDCDCGSNPCAPWDSVKDRILEIRIMEGITEVGVNAFRNCRNLEKVVLPHSLRRIHAYAFRDCKKLVSMETDRQNFKYIYDDCEYAADDTIIFGVESFHNVPWSIARWGNFYIQEDRMYVTFAGDSEKLEVPEGVRVLKSFSMNHLNVDSVILPETLEVIEDFAFSGSKVKEIVTLPDSAEKLADYALADCSIVWEGSPSLEKMAKNNRKRKEADRNRFPVYFKRYSLSLMSRKSFGKFRKFKVTENRQKQKRDGFVSSYVYDSSADVGNSIYRRIHNGNVVLCVAYKDHRIVSVKSFAWDSGEKITNEYLMYPVIDEKYELAPWRDSFTYQEKEEIVGAFGNFDGKHLKEDDVLRYPEPDTHEEWFWSNDRENFGGPLEMEFLHMWLSLHSEITVDSIKENIEKDEYRWFVEV